MDNGHKSVKLQEIMQKILHLTQFNMTACYFTAYYYSQYVLNLRKINVPAKNLSCYRYLAV